MTSTSLPSSPLISVIIPIYNVENYISQCLGSIVNQTYSNLEIICIDDGSTDNSAKIISNFSILDKRIILITQNNEGVSVARNKGIAKSTGEFITFVDSDDYLEPNAIEIIYKHFKTPDIDFVSFGHRSFSTESILSSPESSQTSIYKNPRTFFSHKSWILYISVTAWSKMYRTSFIKSNNLLFPIGLLNEDTAFHWSCISYARKIVLASEIVYNYRIRLGSIMSTIRERRKNIGLHFLYNLDVIYECWSKNKFIESNRNLFQYLFEIHVRLSFTYANQSDIDTLYYKIKFYSKKWGIEPRKFTLAYDLLHRKKTNKLKYRFFNSLRKKYHQLISTYNHDSTFFPTA